MPEYRFGKHPPRLDYRTLRFQSYLTPDLPPAPKSYDVLDRVYANLKAKDPGKLFPMDGNDHWGDCTIAAVAHAITAYRGLIGRKTVMTEAEVVKVYMHLTGGVDAGLPALDVLNYWRHTAVHGDRIIAYVKVDARNHEHVQQAIRLFGGVYLGFQVPEQCLAQFKAGATWTPGPLTMNGHAVFAVSYDPKTVGVLTWGNVQRGTWGWWDECVDEAYAILAPEAKDEAFQPGFDFRQLEEDLADVAATVP